MEVLKHTSPTVRVAAPRPRPQKRLPSASTRAALAPGGRKDSARASQSAREGAAAFVI